MGKGQKLLAHKSAPAVPYSILSSFKLPFTIHALSQLSHVIGKTRKK